MGKFGFLTSVVSSGRMGCRGSKEDGDEAGTSGGHKGNGDKTSGGGAGPSTAAGANSANADQRIPMTAKQKYSIVASWKGIHRALEPTGICMFVK